MRGEEEIDEEGPAPRKRAYLGLGTGLCLAWAAALVLVVGLVVSVALWRMLLNQEQRAMMLALEDEALHVAADMRSWRLQRIAAFNRMAQRVAAQEQEALWELEGGLLLDAWKSIDVLMWVRPAPPDRWVITRPEPDALRDPGLTPELRRAMDAAAAAGEEQFLPRLPAGPGVGEAVVVPCLRDGDQSFLVVIMRLPDLIEELFSPGVLERYAVVIEDDVGDRHHYGAPPLEDVLSSPAPLTFDGSVWWVRVAPAGVRWSQLRTVLPIVVLLFGVIVSTLLAVTVGSLGLARRRAEIAESLSRRLGREVRETRRIEEVLRSNEQALRDLVRRLEQSNEDLDRFGSVVAHDLKEPLITVRMYADEIRHALESGMSSKIAEHADRIGRVALRMSSLVEALLAHARVTTAEVVLQPLGLSDVARAVADEIGDRVRKEGGSIEIGELPVVEADSSQMRQLFQNLIGNSIKFRRQEEPPRVKVEAEPARVEENGRGPWWRITVTDNGIGLEPGEIDRLFIEFSRLRAAEEREGAGMGLAICRRIVERHGGRIRAIPNVGPGTTIEIVLPSRAGPSPLPGVGAGGRHDASTRSLDHH